MDLVGEVGETDVAHEFLVDHGGYSVGEWGGGHGGRVR